MENKGRGEKATRDMALRIAAGWTVEKLWDRNAKAVRGDGFTYEYAEAADLALASVKNLVES